MFRLKTLSRPKTAATTATTATTATQVATVATVAVVARDRSGVSGADLAVAANDPPETPAPSTSRYTPQGAHDAQARMDELKREFAVGLRLGCVVLCASCRHFRPRSGDAPDGWCRKFMTATWSGVPFLCGGCSGRQ